MSVRFQWFSQVSKWGPKFALHGGVNMRLPIGTLVAKLVTDGSMSATRCLSPRVSHQLPRGSSNR